MLCALSFLFGFLLFLNIVVVVLVLKNISAGCQGKVGFKIESNINILLQLYFN